MLNENELHKGSIEVRFHAASFMIVPKHPRCEACFELRCIYNVLTRMDLGGSGGKTHKVREDPVRGGGGGA